MYFYIMKYIFTTFIVSLSLLSFVSCVKQTVPSSTQTPVERLERPAPVFKAVEYKENIVSEIGIDEGKPQVKIELSLLSVEASEDFSKFIYQTLYNGKTPEEYKNNVVEGWKAEYNGLWSGFTEEDSSLASLSGSYDEKVTVVFQNQSALVLKREIYEYKGGAHGNTEAKYFNIDLEKNGLLTLDSLLIAEAKPQLLKYIEEALRNYASTKPELLQILAQNESITEVYSFWEGYLNDLSGLPVNFFLTTEALGIHWDPYEIAAYAVGAVEITLPYNTIDNILSEQGRSLINKLKAGPAGAL